MLQVSQLRIWKPSHCDPYPQVRRPRRDRVRTRGTDLLRTHQQSERAGYCFVSVYSTCRRLRHDARLIEQRCTYAIYPRRRPIERRSCSADGRTGGCFAQKYKETADRYVIEDKVYVEGLVRSLETDIRIARETSITETVEQ